MEWEPYRALYLHVPFCKRRCAYCDFPTSAAPSDSPALDEYVEAQIRAIRRASREGMLGSIETVYFGGGTPSYLGNRRLSSLLYALSVSMHLTPEVECTLEANPESFTPAMAKDLFALGVTRMSFGVQSFDDDLLARLGRIHSSVDAQRAIEAAQVRFENLSIDLMCGLPGQTLEGFLADVERALSFGVPHLSIYPLAVEEGTPLHRAVESGEEEVDEDFGAACMVAAAELLSARGYRRYEVSNYARPGFESRHNSAYWTGKPYLGLGPGAVSMRQRGSVRERFDEDGLIERIEGSELEAERLMLLMRLSEGISDGRLSEAAAWLPGAQSAFVDLEREGYLAHEGGRWMPTEKGWLLGNRLYGRILDLA